MSWHKGADASRDAKMAKMGVRSGYAEGGRAKNTTVNVIIAPPQGGAGGAPPPAEAMPVPVPTPAPPMPAPPNPMEALMAAAGGGGGGAPPGAGPMPPMRSGGRTAHAKGGRTGSQARPLPGAADRTSESRMATPGASARPSGASSSAQASSGSMADHFAAVAEAPRGPKGKAGLMARNANARNFQSTVARMGHASGGKVTADPNVHMDAGSGGGLGRLEKAKDYGTGDGPAPRRGDRKPRK